MTVLVYFCPPEVFAVPKIPNPYAPKPNPNSKYVKCARKGCGLTRQTFEMRLLECCRAYVCLVDCAARPHVCPTE